ncbi:unnamed protein product [Arctogadus glacialis]
MAAIWFTQRGAADRREQPCPNRSQRVDAHLGLKGEPSCGAIPRVVYRADSFIRSETRDIAVHRPERREPDL